MGTWIEYDETIKFELIIAGKTYYPDYVKPKMKISLNAVPLEFNNIPGALVVDGEIGFRKFDLRLIFQGGDHVDTTEEFMWSLYNRGEWLLTHPYYGKIVCKPATFEIDNESLNVSYLNIEVWETISETDLDLWRTTYATYELSPPEITEPVADISKLSKAVQIIIAIADAKAKLDENLATVKNTVDKIDRYLNTIGSDLVSYMGQVEYLTRTVGNFYDTVENRISAVKEAWERMTGAFIGVNSDLQSALGLKKFDKQAYEASGHSFVMAMIDATTISQYETGLKSGVENPESEQDPTKEQIESRIAALVEMYNGHIAVLSAMQSLVDNKTTSYYPNFKSIYDLQGLVFSSIIKMSESLVGNNAEITYKVERNIGLIPLAYSLIKTTNSKKIKEFADRNKLTMDERILVPKGRIIKYKG